jgi:hypothetical protein
MIEWMDIWTNDPIRNEEMLFITGDKEIHYGEIFSQEKLRKCKFHCFVCKADYECDSTTELQGRVTHWIPIPEPPETK